jgi:hypothetical protein
MKVTLKSLWLPLIVPFLLIQVPIVIVVYCLHEWDWGNVLINLFTEVIGVAITVGYVDYIIGRHKAKQWQGAEQGILLRLRTFVVSSVIKIRVSFGYPGFPDAAILSSLSYSSEYPEFRKLVGESESTAKQKIASLDIGHGRSFAESLKDIQRESETLVTLFGDKLKASQYESLLNISSIVSRTSFWCQVLVDSMEHSPHWSPVTGMLRDGMATEVIYLLRALTKLGDTLIHKDAASLERAAA